MPKNENKITSIADLSNKKRSIFDPFIAQHRERIMAAEPPVEPAQVPFADMLVPISARMKVNVRIYSPLQGKAPYRTFFYIPRTAFIAHESKFTKVICSYIAKLANCQVIVPIHRLAPESFCPEGLQECYQVMKFFIRTAPYNQFIDHSKIILGGYSSGGNIAASMAIQARKDGIPIAAQVLISLIVDLTRSLKAFKKLENQDTAITEEFVNWFIDCTVPEDEEANAP